MKKLITPLLGTLLLVSCVKEKQIKKETLKTPLFIKIEALYSNDLTITSEVILVR